LAHEQKKDNLAQQQAESLLVLRPTYPVSTTLNTHLSLIFSLHGYFLPARIYEKALFPLFLR